VTPRGVTAANVEDLKGKRVAVQYETEPQNLVAPRDDVTAVTVLSPEEGMKALAEGRADAAFLWGASAGYLNKTAYDGRFAVTLVDGAGLAFPTAIGFARASAELRDAVDAVLPEVSRQFPALLAKYGVRSDGATVVAEADGATMKSDASPQSFPVVAQNASAQPAPNAGKASGPPAGDGSGPFDVAPADPSADAKPIADGKETFNGTCAHCHGPDAVQGVKKIDLRRLQLRYGDGAVNMYWKTVHEGRPEKGMPAWNEVFSEEQLTDIEAFVFSIQSKE
jgi:polar amino acid transport system substrate-binding protein